MVALLIASSLLSYSSDPTFGFPLNQLAARVAPREGWGVTSVRAALQDEPGDRTKATVEMKIEKGAGRPIQVMISFLKPDVSPAVYLRDQANTTQAVMPWQTAKAPSFTGGVIGEGSLAGSGNGFAGIAAWKSDVLLTLLETSPWGRARADASPPDRATAGQLDLLARQLLGNAFAVENRESHAGDNAVLRLLTLQLPSPGSRYKLVRADCQSTAISFTEDRAALHLGLTWAAEGDRWLEMNAFVCQSPKTAAFLLSRQLNPGPIHQASKGDLADGVRIADKHDGYIDYVAKSGSVFLNIERRGEPLPGALDALIFTKKAEAALVKFRR